jgi:hypothetical protein
VPAKPAQAPPRPKRNRAKPKPSAPKPRSGSKRLTPQIRTTLCDRLEAAIESGLIELCDEDMPCESLDFTLNEIALLMRILLPEEYVAPERTPEATGTAPGTAERIAAYAGRVARGESLTAKGDATATGVHARGLKIVQRTNGSGPRIVGWADEGHDPPGEGEEV